MSNRTKLSKMPFLFPQKTHLDGIRFCVSISIISHTPRLYPVNVRNSEMIPKKRNTHKPLTLAFHLFPKKASNYSKYPDFFGGGMLKYIHLPRLTAWIWKWWVWKMFLPFPGVKISGFLAVKIFPGLRIQVAGRYQTNWVAWYLKFRLSIDARLISNHKTMDAICLLKICAYTDSAKKTNLLPLKKNKKTNTNIVFARYGVKQEVRLV